MEKQTIVSTVFRSAMIIAFCVLCPVILGGTPSYDAVIIEEHELPVALADGKYEGERSKYAIGGEKTYTDVDRKRCINILEVVPDKRMAMIGYTIGGQEPIGAADMDAIVNTYPGSEAGWRPNFSTCGDYNVSNRYGSSPAITDLAMNSGKESAMYYYAKTMNGYYEYVGPDKGVYALKEIPGEWDSSRRSGIYIKDVIMVSKYKENRRRFATGYDYVWVEDESLGSFESESADHKTLVADVDKGTDTGKKIYVYNHKKNVCVNNEIFLCFMSDICPGVDHSKGAYSGAVTGGGPSYLDIPENRYQWPQDKRIKENSNYEIINGEEGWKKKTCSIEVITKEPGEVEIADVDNADLIIICRGDSDGSYKTAFGINCYAFNDYSPKKNIGEGNDFSVNVLKRIYKHVVVDMDLAIAYSCETAPNPQYFNTNVGRLGCMLFYINNEVADGKLESGESRTGTGRDFFKNLLKDYGKIKSGDSYVTDVNDTYDKIDGTPVYDLIYIGDDGKLYVNGSENVNGSGGWDEGAAKFYRDWLYNNDLRRLYYKGNIDEWINNTTGNNYIKENFTGLGFYAIDSYISGQYLNQLFFVEDYLLYQYSDSGKAKNLFEIMSRVDHHTPHYSMEEGASVEKTCFLTMNIVNGDSVTPKSADDWTKNNKTIYVNKYELDKMNETSDGIDLAIEIETSHKIKSINVEKKDGTAIASYAVSAGLLGAGSFDGLTVEDTTTYGEDSKPIGHNEEKGYYKYKMKIPKLRILKKWFDRGSNNSIVIRVENEYGITSTDMITIVTRDFFMLN